MNTPELLSPAGTLKNMRYAFAYGADAVYAGQPRYSLRVRNNEFSKEPVLAQGIEEAHALGKRFFLASNLAPHNNKVKTYLADLVRATREHPQWAGHKSVEWGEDVVAAFDAVVIATAHDCVDHGDLTEWADLIIDTRNAMTSTIFPSIPISTAVNVSYSKMCCV